jgi:threonine dehydratase
MRPPTLDDIRAAQPTVYGALRPSPLLRHPLLAERLGCDVWVKHENHNPTGAFKVRGGVHLVSRLSSEDRVRGVISATTGNHGQSIAFAAARAGVPCTLVVPLNNNPAKNAMMRAWGATLIEHGRDFDEARELVEKMCEAQNLRYVHAANEPDLIAGVGTYALEIFEALADVDTILVPIGGGSGACGLITVRDGLSLKTRIVGVGAERADAVARSWRTGARVVGESADTFAEGIATRVTFDLTFGILTRGLDDFITLSEAQLAEGVRLSLDLAHNLAEGAGAAAIAAAVAHQDRFSGNRIVCVMSGGNMDGAVLRRLLGSGLDPNGDPSVSCAARMDRPRSH